MVINHNLQYPRVAVGGLVINKDKILLVKRAKPPAQGLWALPGGKLKWGESLAQGVEREVLEETGLTIKAGDIIYTFENIVRGADDSIQFHYVIIDLMAHLVDFNAKPIPGDDAKAVKWLTLNQLQQYPVSKATLNLIYKIGFPVNQHGD